MVTQIAKCAQTLLRAGSKVAGKSGGGYSRLKGIFTSGMNYQNYGKIVETAERAVVGNIPGELITLIAKTNPENKAQLIKRVQKGFTNATYKLSKAQEKQLQYIKGISTKSEKEAFMTEQLTAGKVTMPMSKKALEMQQRAALSIENSLKGILPGGAKINIEHLGEGAFGTGYRVQFISKNGSKLMNDRVLKVYNSENYVLNKISVNMTIEKRLLNEYDEKFFTEIVKKHYGDELSVKSINGWIRGLKKYIGNMSPNDMNSRQSMIKEFFTRSKNFHGVAAEANSAAYIKRVVGHDLSKTDIIKPDMFDLKNGFSLARFADNSLPRVTSKTNFKNIGIDAQDLHSQNIIADRVIDFGGMTLNNPKLADKTVMKYFKKIMNRENPAERSALVERYKQLAENPKTPLRNKIHEAIELAIRS